MISMPKTAEERKQHPVTTGVLDYFPDAILAIANVSLQGNEQHNPGQPLHWDRSKSQDEADALVRHLMERGTKDSDGTRHSAKMAWRALALLQKEIEAEEKMRPDPLDPAFEQAVKVAIEGAWVEPDSQADGHKDSALPPGGDYEAVTWKGRTFVYSQDYDAFVPSYVAAPPPRKTVTLETAGLEEGEAAHRTGSSRSVPGATPGASGPAISTSPTGIRQTTPSEILGSKWGLEQIEKTAKIRPAVQRCNDPDCVCQINDSGSHVEGDFR